MLRPSPSRKSYRSPPVIPALRAPLSLSLFLYFSWTVNVFILLFPGLVSDVLYMGVEECCSLFFIHVPGDVLLHVLVFYSSHLYLGLSRIKLRCMHKKLPEASRSRVSLRPTDLQTLYKTGGRTWETEHSVLRGCYYGSGYRSVRAVCPRAGKVVSRFLYHMHNVRMES